MQEFFALALHQLGDGDAGPAFDDLCDFLLRHLVTQKVALLCALGKLLFVRKLLFQLRQLAVFQPCGRFKVIFLFGALNLRAQLLDTLTKLLHLADGVFLVLPLGLHAVELFALLGQLLAKLGQTAL